MHCRPPRRNRDLQFQGRLTAWLYLEVGYVDGKAKIRCDFISGSLTNLKIETRLQKWNGSSWVTVTNSTNITTFATVKSGKECTGVSGFIPCATGIFRTQSRGSGTLNGSKDSSPDWQTTSANKGAKDPCVKPLQPVSVR